MHPVEDIRRRPWLSKGWIECELWRSQEVGGRQIPSDRNPSDRKFRSVGKKRCWNENHVPAEAGLPGPRLSSPGERERNAAMARRVGFNILQFCSVFNSPLTDNTFRNPFEPFQIKWEVYFSKELCPLVFIVLNMFLLASAYEYVTLRKC